MFWNLKNLIQTALNPVKRCDIPGMRVVVSLTTIPSRIHLIGKTIGTLINQTRPPDEIVITVPRHSLREERPYVIPSFLENIVRATAKRRTYRRLPTMPVVTILRSEKDWGPATKFIPVLQRELQSGQENTLCIIVDDDRFYVNTLVSNFLKYYRENTGAVLCNRGRTFETSRIYATTKVHEGPKISQPETVDIITGVGGYAIPCEIVRESLWNYTDAPESAFYMDDIWISGWLAKHGITRIVVPTTSNLRFASTKRNRHLSRLSKRNRALDELTTLDDIPGPENPREFHNNRVIEHYSRYW